jgi:hypothetical protein
MARVNSTVGARSWAPVGRTLYLRDTALFVKEEATHILLPHEAWWSPRLQRLAVP